jgi:hypothetical protein
MSFVVAVPEALGTAASDLAAIGSNVSAAHTAAAAGTLAVLPAAADEVSASIAQLFSQHAAGYQGMAAQAAAFNDQFVQHLTAGAFSYASIEAAIASFLQDIPPQLVPFVGFPFAVVGIGLFAGFLLFIFLLDVAYGLSPALTTQFTMLLAQLAQFF